MKKELKILSIVLLSIIFLSVVVQFALAQAPATTATTDKIIDPVKDLFYNDFIEGDISTSIAKYLLWAVVAILLYSILETVKPLRALPSPLKLILVVILSFLGIAYLAPSEVYAILLSYNALGFILAAALPFVILIFFTISITKEGGVGTQIFAKIMWFGFIAFLLYRTIAGMVSGQLSVGMGLGYGGFIIAAIIYIFYFHGYLMKLWFKEEIVTARARSIKKLRLQKDKLDAESAIQKENAEVSAVDEAAAKFAKGAPGA